MPQLGFVQVIIAAALAAFVGIGLAFPVGAKFGSRAGRWLLRGCLIGLLLAIAASLLWANGSGELAVFNRRLGADGWIQIGGFFFIILFTGYTFASRYIDDKAREEREAEGA